jgi:glycosyltransferase involved in cell wall biosynthesis
MISGKTSGVWKHCTEECLRELDSLKQEKKGMADRRKVLWLIRGLGAGGAEKLLAMSLPYLNWKVFDYQVAYFLKSKSHSVPEFERAGVRVFCLNSESPFDFRVLFRLVRLLRKQEIEILHVFSPYAGIVGRLAARLAGVKAVVYTEHSTLENQNALGRLGNILTYPLNDATIGVSQAVLRSVLRWQLARRGTFQTIYNGIDLNALDTNRVNPDQVKKSLGINPRHRVVGNVAHLRPAKGHLYLLQAARLVLDQYPEVTFVVVGREKVKGYLRRLEEVAERLEIGDRVLFTGFRPDAIQITSAFDIFVLSSLWEGFGIVLLEAMALGKPVIGTRVGGIPEVIEDGVNGYLVEPRNPEQLAEKVVQLLGDEALRSQMGQQGMQRVRDRFSIRDTVKAVEDVYTSVLNAKGGIARGGTKSMEGRSSGLS